MKYEDTSGLLCKKELKALERKFVEIRWVSQRYHDRWEIASRLTLFVDIWLSDLFENPYEELLGSECYSPVDSRKSAKNKKALERSLKRLLRCTERGFLLLGEYDRGLKLNKMNGHGSFSSQEREFLIKHMLRGVRFNEAWKKLKNRRHKQWRRRYKFRNFLTSVPNWLWCLSDGKFYR